jgi:hypothetical protein
MCNKSYQNGINDFFVGLIVLAPRFIDNKICYDLALIIDYDKEVITPHYNLKDNNTRRYYENDVSPIKLKLVWLRPMSYHEISSTGFELTGNQVKPNGTITAFLSLLLSLLLLTTT